MADFFERLDKIRAMAKAARNRDAAISTAVAIIVGVLGFLIGKHTGH
jgi:hypothetical protein